MPGQPERSTGKPASGQRSSRKGPGRSRSAGTGSPQQHAAPVHDEGPDPRSAMNVECREILVEQIRRTFFPNSGSRAQKPEEYIDAALSRCVADLADRAIRGQRIDQCEIMLAPDLDQPTRVMIVEAAVRDLGTRWRCNDTGFVEVTMAVMRLQTYLRGIEANNHNGASSAQAYEAEHRHVLLTAPEGELHTFPLTVLEKQFRLRGWHTVTALPTSREPIADILAIRDFSAICLCWSDSRLFEKSFALAREIASLTRRHETLFLAGGDAATRNEKTLQSLGVDNICHNTYFGIELAELFVEKHQKQSAPGRKSNNKNNIQRLY